MFISDLSYLEVANEEICGGSGRRNSRNRTRRDVDVKVNIDVKKDIDADVDIKGNLADALADAYAFGDNSLAETNTMTYANRHSSKAFSDSLSAVD